MDLSENLIWLARDSEKITKDTDKEKEKQTEKEKQVEKEKQKKLADVQSVQRVKGSLKLNNLNNITSNVNLTSENNGVKITWTSNNKSIISDDGKVTRPEAKDGDAIVTLTATFTKGEAKDTENFIVTVKAKEITDEEFVDEALKSIQLKQDLNCIVDNIKLPSSDKKNTVNITWNSDKPSVVSNNGEVTRTYKDERVVIEATVKKGSILKTKKFNITVKAKEKDVEAEINLVASSLKINNANNIDKDIDLPTSVNGALIAWVSNKPFIVSNSGKVIRPEIGKKDENVTLKATITKDGKSVTKDFTINVLAQKELIANTPEELDNIVKKAVEDCKEKIEISLPNFSSNQAAYNFNKFNDSMTELGGMDFGKPSPKGSFKFDGIKCIMTITFTYNRDINEIKRQKEETLKEVKRIVKEKTNDKMSKFEKELALHDYLVKIADYNSANYKNHINELEDHNAYGVLIKHIGVCESYAKAMSLLLNEAGIECKYVTGVSVRNGVDGGGHAWNIVKLDDGNWYNLDATWDDPVSDRNGTASLTEDSNSTVNHTYFNIPDSIFNRDHKRGKFEQSFPACTATKYSYNNMDVDEYASDGTLIKKVTSIKELDEAILDALKNKKSNLSLRIRGFKMSQEDLGQELSKVASKNRIGFNGGSISVPDEYHVNYNIKY
ncbi:immunoglobulin-like domain-containing protein [Clostridium niameyense]|uniref:immunoglobulin-like domain-containing protein n=1 Tax=Clostridium niameyense TaxID=1622073 RepID=UPI00311AB4ED